MLPSFHVLSRIFRLVLNGKVYQINYRSLQYLKKSLDRLSIHRVMQEMD
jgi:hypothetical protein